MEDPETTVRCAPESTAEFLWRIAFRCVGLTASFNPIQVYPIQPRQFGKLILRHAFFAANDLYPLANYLLNVLQAIRLWRMLL